MFHDLKIHTSYFEPVIRGLKKFEIRDNSDRGFQVGDIVTLREVDKVGLYTRRQQDIEITYVSNYNQPPNQVVFAFTLLDREGGD